MQYYVYTTGLNKYLVYASNRKQAILEAIKEFHIKRKNIVGVRIHKY